MAYRNHPTRYLIVKDRVASPPLPAVSRKRQPTLPAFPCQALFFKTRRLVCRRPPSGFPKRRACLRVPVRPVKHFFQSPFRPFGDPAALPFFAARRELLRIPARPVNTFFHSPRRTVVPRSASPFSVGAEERVYARPPGPSTLFFKSRPGFWRPLVGPGAVSRSADFQDYSPCPLIVNCLSPICRKWRSASWPGMCNFRRQAARFAPCRA